MTVFVLVLGVVAVVLGLVVVISPRHMRWALDSMVKPSTVPLLAIVRIGCGIALVIASAETRLPIFVWALGLLVIVRGAALPILGVRRVLKMARWWQEQPDKALRAPALLAILFGALLVWAAM